MYCIEIKTSNLAVLNAIKAVASLDKDTLIDEPKTYELSQAPSIKKIMAQISKMPKDEVEKIKAEVRAEMFGN